MKSESTFSYFEALEGYLHNHGRPVAFYSDKHTVFRVAKEDAKGGARYHAVWPCFERAKRRDSMRQ